MIKEKIADPAGFRVIHEFGGWRMAYHAYKEEVNSVNALKKWGVHVESDEAFVLICGEVMLATAGTLEAPESVNVEHLEPGRLYVVESKERHAIVLKENAAVLIVENRDMSNFIETEIEEDDLKALRSAAEEVQLGTCE